MKNILGDYNVMLLHSPMLNQDGEYGGMSNPVIYDKFATFMKFQTEAPKIVWDAFANRFGDCIEFFINRGIEVISHNIDPEHPSVLKRNSTICGPGKKVGGVIIHPPYFGSSPQSNKEGELSLCPEVGYFIGLSNHVGLVVDSLDEKGYVCAVGRHYRTKGRAIRLDEWFVGKFSGLNFKLVEVWRSTPDVAIVMQKFHVW